MEGQGNWEVEREAMEAHERKLQEQAAAEAAERQQHEQDVQSWEHMKREAERPQGSTDLPVDPTELEGNEGQ